MSVIDLGELGAEPAGPAPAANRGARRRLLRSPALAALGVLLLATVAGGAPLPGPTTGVTIPARLGAPVLLASDRVFIADPAGSLNHPGDREIAAYRLSDGKLLWRARPVPYREPQELHLMAVTGGTLLVMDRLGGLEPGARPQVVALDAATGRVLWRRTGFPSGDLGGESLLLWLPATPQTPTRLVAVAVDSGEELWSFTLPESDVVVLAEDDVPERDYLAVLGPDRVQLRDARTGAVRAERRLPRAGDKEPAIGRFVGGLLLVQRDTFGALTAYGLPRLDQRWSMALRPDRGFGVESCGDALCLMSSKGLRVIDPADGRTRWSDERAGDLRRVGDRLILLTNAAVPMPQTIVVLDPATGRQLGDFGAWSVVDSERADGRVVATRRRAETGRMQVALLDPATLTVHTVAMLDRISGECETAGGDVLVCRRLDSSLGVWALPS